jgi:aspartate aminotransferase
MEKVSKRIAALADSQTLAMNQKSKDLEAKGIDIINLSVGEPDFFTPDHVKDAAKKAIDDNFTFYSPVPGYPDLRKAIAHKLKVENNLTYGAPQIIVSNGAKHSLANVIMALVDPGEEVLILAPYWVSYVELVKLAEGKNVIIETSIDNDFKATAKQIEEAITSKTRAMIICSPSNPTGSVYSKAELEAIARVIEKHSNIIVISDEIYEHINFVGRHESIAQFDFLFDRVVVINGVSKGYSMTGWRIGYMAAPCWIVNACNKLQGQFTSGPSSIAQKAAVAAITGDMTFTRDMNKAFKRRRDLVLSLMKDIPGMKINVPEGAFYVFPDMSNYFGKSYQGKTIENSDDLSLFLLEHAHVASVSGDAFGAPECVRFSYATSDEKLREAFVRVKNALALLN